jgi:DNA-directed RNA polymerase subunit RPC12/RpoP
MHQQEALLGKLAVRNGLCTQEQVDECLRIQSMNGSEAPLGDILVYKGYLKEPQLKELLSRQQRKPMICSACNLSFAVLTLSPGRGVECPKCRGLLVERNPEGVPRSDAELSTGRVRVTPSAAGPRLRHVCIICDQVFEEAADSTGRVRCPSCRSTFTSHSSP